MGQIMLLGYGVYAVCARAYNYIFIHPCTHNEAASRPTVFLLALAMGVASASRRSSPAFAPPTVTKEE